MSNSRPGLNTDLEELSGFGMVNSFASKSNCFSHRASDLDQHFKDTNGPAFLLQTQFSNDINNQKNQIYTDQNSRRVHQDEVTTVLEPMLKFPEIRRDTSFVDPTSENS